MRQLLATARWRVLPGVSIVFSGVYPKTPGAGDRWHALAIKVSDRELDDRACLPVDTPSKLRATQTRRADHTLNVIDFAPHPKILGRSQASRTAYTINISKFLERVM